MGMRGLEDGEAFFAGRPPPDHVARGVAVKLSRLVQPRNPAFWLMIAFNILSSVFAWAMRAFPLDAVALSLVGGLALANAVMGIRMAWRLLREEPAREGSREP